MNTIRQRLVDLVPAFAGLTLFLGALAGRALAGPGGASVGLAVGVILASALLLVFSRGARV